MKTWIPKVFLIIAILGGVAILSGGSDRITGGITAVSSLVFLTLTAINNRKRKRRK